MDRRDMLRMIGAGVGTVVAAGCLSGPPGGSPSGPGDVETSFTVLDVTSGTERNVATVDTEGTTVVIEGTIPGPNGCYTAELADITVEDGLTVTVRSVEREATGTPACTQAIVEIDYRATVTFDGKLPGSVRVLHEAMGETTEVASTEL